MSDNTTHKFAAPAAMAVSALALCLLSGCMSFNPKSMRVMEQSLLENNPDLVIESSTKFGLGALALDFIDLAFVHDRAIDLSKISRAEIGIYQLTGTLAFHDVRIPPFGNDRSCPRRQIILRIREVDEYVQVAICIRAEKVTGLEMFVFEAKEIVVINARGNMQALITSLVRDRVKQSSRTAARQEAALQPVNQVATR